jgi:hypothetical protein
VRVLKPGGQLLAFGSPRTAHRLAAQNGGAASPARNPHPTVKPLELVRWIPDSAGRREPHLAEFATTLQGLIGLRDWLAAHRVRDVAMEAAGVYWQPVWHILEDDLELTLCNARHVKTSRAARPTSAMRSGCVS